MSTAEFRLPDVGEGITEAEIAEWRVEVGQRVEINRIVVEIETVKARVELPSPFEGTVAALLAEVGETVPVGTPILRVTADVAAAVSGPPDPVAAQEIPSPDDERHPVLVGYGPGGERRKRRTRRSEVPAHQAIAALEPEPAAGSGVLATPAVRGLARELGVDLASIAAPGQRVTEQEVHRAAGAVPEPATAAAAPRPSAVPDEPVTRVPIRGVRRATAEAMVASAFTAPHVTEFLTVDVTRTMDFVDRLRQDPRFAGVRVTPLLLVARALLAAVHEHPGINSAWDEPNGEIVIHREVNLGIAAATPRGLIVPNIKSAQRLSLRELATAIGGLTAKAREGRTELGEMTGGTITVTNIGVFGVDAGTPILNPGEAAILCFGAVRETPWNHEGAVALRHTTQLSLSFDHRLVDGELGSRVLARIGRVLEQPEWELALA